MDNALLVRVMRGVAHQCQQREPISNREFPISDKAVDGMALDQLHRKVRDLSPIWPGRRAGLKDLRNARMTQTAQRLRLVRETTAKCRNIPAAANNLERDRASWIELLGAVDHAHT